MTKNNSDTNDKIDKVKTLNSNEGILLLYNFYNKRNTGIRFISRQHIDDFDKTNSNSPSSAQKSIE